MHTPLEVPQENLDRFLNVSELSLPGQGYAALVTVRLGPRAAHTPWWVNRGITLPLRKRAFERPVSYGRRKGAPNPLGPTRGTRTRLSQVLDEAVANLTSSLQAAGLWEQTLLVLQSE